MTCRWNMSGRPNVWPTVDLPYTCRKFDLGEKMLYIYIYIEVTHLSSNANKSLLDSGLFSHF